MKLTRNGFFLMGVTMFLGCGASRPAEPPKLVHGGWVLRKTETRPLAEAPESVAHLKPARIWKTYYEGPQNITAAWVEFSNATVAFEAIQNYRKNPQTMAFHRGPFLILVERGDIPAQALGDFAEGVGKAIR